MSLDVAATDLPPRLTELVGVIGLPATLRLVEARGGTRFYVPAKASPDHWLTSLIGLEALQALVRARAADMVELDRADAAMRAARDRIMREAHASGSASTSMLALQYGLTQRQVFNILARDGRHALDQLDMFQDASG